MMFSQLNTLIEKWLYNVYTDCYMATDHWSETAANNS